ncbi:MAG TPA: ATP-binding protein, partial [Candidatus Mcinerneyibacterium sp.]|nr:ATP-binding protein [Candidatus Mcinerneyibacterium sp.]
SDFIYLKIIEDVFWEFLKINKLLQKIKADEILLAIVEGVVNAIKHGNNNDLKQDVSFFLFLEKKYLNIIIKDKGKGFNLKDLKDPTKGKNLTNKNGRGIFIMKNFMDKVNYNFSSDGTELHMRKEIL